MIDRKELVSRHNPVLNYANNESPLTVGNGEFAFTADITGMQTLYGEYRAVPLCTMSQWGWHTKPDNGRCYELSDLDMTYYDFNGRMVRYASEIAKSGSENEKIYNWLRKNPHRLNLARIALLLDGKKIHVKNISNIRQELTLYSGILKSEFSVSDCDISVETICSKTKDILGFGIKTSSLDRVGVSVSFPYGSHKIHASDWENTENHSISCEKKGSLFIIKHTLDDDFYFTAVKSSASIKQTGDFEIVLNGDLSEFTVMFGESDDFPDFDFRNVKADSEKGWADFWQTGGAIDFSGSHDSRMTELERRCVLSQYLIAVNSSGSIPPQETGLVCNSWYGKFHLEMHILHSGWLPLWGRGNLLEKSLGWYRKTLGNAKENAHRNGYKGARWVKMTGPSGVDSPSRIAVLLIWQQPHIIYMLEMIKNGKAEKQRCEFMNKYRDLVFETAEFMADFVVYSEKTGRFDLIAPVIPVQEVHKPESVLNPSFEVCYWQFGLNIAVNWAKELEYDQDKMRRWKNIASNMALPPVNEGLYIAHEKCPDTFERFNTDHPSMLFGYGFINGLSIDKNTMNCTYDKVLRCWDFQSCWGWDFALMAMTLAKLGRLNEALDVLLMDTEKNHYVTSGNNFQRGRTDLPLYLPGNGALLFALAYISNIGLPENLGRKIKIEGIKMPY